MVTNNKDLYNIRVGSEDKKKEFRRRTANIKEECKATPRDIYEAGLKVYEKGKTINHILNRRDKTITERDIYLYLLIDSNKRIIGFNRQLKNKSDRYKELADDDNVLYLYDENGNEITQIELDAEKLLLKNEMLKYL